jgi:hypothetical protein
MVKAGLPGIYCSQLDALWWRSFCTNSTSCQNVNVSTGRNEFTCHVIVNRLGSSKSKKGVLNAKFVHEFQDLLKIMIPGWFSREVGVIGIHSGNTAKTLR